MDQQVINALVQAGIDASLQVPFPSVEIEVDEAGVPRPAGKTATVGAGDKRALVELRPVSALLTGTRQPPSFQSGPTPEYMTVFMMLESAVLGFCASTGRLEYDEEVARLYNLLRRRPDGSDANPLFSYLQATLRLYLSLRDGSQAEVEAVLNRLTRSAKRYAENAASTNYLRLLSEHLQAG